MPRHSRRACVRALSFLVLGCAVAPSAHADGTVRLSVDRSRHDSDGPSSAPSISADARFVAFASEATDLVRDDRNGVADVFVRDRLRGSTERVSVDSAEREALGPSFDPSISADGRYVAFTSAAENLVQDDTNHWSDVFVRDRLRGITIRVSVATGGGQGSEGSFAPAIAGDGRCVAFVSQAPDLVADDQNFSWDVFVHEIAGGTTERVSVDSLGVEANSGSIDVAISGDGALVAFSTLASNLAADDQNLLLDIYLRDRRTDVTERLTRGLDVPDPDDHSLRPSLSADGLTVAFESRASNLIRTDGNGASDVFVLDRRTGACQRASVDSFGIEADGDSFAPSLAATGRWLVFTSTATHLVGDDGNGAADVFVHDLENGLTARASLTMAGREGNGASGEGCVSSNGDNVAFTSSATNLVARDRNRAADVFSRERCSNEASWAYYGSGWPGTLGEPQLVPGGDPELNRDFQLSISNSAGAATPALLVIGPSKIALQTNRDGTLLAEPRLLHLFALPAAGTVLHCPIPPDESACGMELDVQVLEWDLGATRSVSFSQGLELILGY